MQRLAARLAAARRRLRGPVEEKRRLREPTEG